VSAAPSEAGESMEKLQERLGVAIGPGLLERALTHRSYAY
jgi:dsRNA-specific ribonuclease